MPTDAPAEPEQPVIRPPSEAGSVLVRVTRGCAWNRCRFCGIYPHLGAPSYSMRNIEEIRSDVHTLAAMFPDARNVFLGDADPLAFPEKGLAAVLGEVRHSFPKLERITSYARASTMWRLGLDGLSRLAAAGMSRLHVGLESGDFTTLRLHRKGQSPRVLVESGRWAKAAGLELSWYVLLGLGGTDRWREHADGTAEVINAVDPHFVRLRRLWLYGGEADGGPECPLWELVRAGRFTPQTPEGTVHELRRMLTRIEGVTAFLSCDHGNNYVRVKGRLMIERDAMVAKIDRFLALPPERREKRYRRVGSRL